MKRFDRLALVLASAAMLAATPSHPDTHGMLVGALRQHVKHIFVIYQENHTGDIDGVRADIAAITESGRAAIPGDGIKKATTEPHGRRLGTSRITTRRSTLDTCGKTASFGTTSLR